MTQCAGNDISRRISNDVDIKENMGDGSMVARVGKERAGRLLDGREWNEIPKSAI